MGVCKKAQGVHSMIPQRKFCDKHRLKMNKRQRFKEGEERFYCMQCEEEKKRGQQ